MCSDLKSPMLQVLSNTSLKAFFSTPPKFCLGALRPPPPPRPPRNAAFWPSATLFALLQMPSLQNLKKFLGALPF